MVGAEAYTPVSIFPQKPGKTSSVGILMRTTIRSTLTTLTSHPQDARQSHDIIRASGEYQTHVAHLKC